MIVLNLLIASIVGALIFAGTLIGMGGVLFLLGSLFHYFKDMYHEHTRTQAS